MFFFSRVSFTHGKCAKMSEEILCCGTTDLKFADACRATNVPSIVPRPRFLIVIYDLGILRVSSNDLAQTVD